MLPNVFRRFCIIFLSLPTGRTNTAVPGGGGGGRPGGFSYNVVI
jgi:hypothetical protein